MAFMRGTGFAAHFAADVNDVDASPDGKPTTNRLIEQFTNMYQEIESRLERGLSHAKEATLESKLRISSNSALIGANAGMTANDVTCEMLDLKAEMTSLKNKLFQAE